MTTNMKELLENIMRKKGTRHYVRAIKHNEELITWLKSITKGFGDELEIPEMVYIALNGVSDVICPYGNKKNFKTIVTGYAFCSRTCRCKKEHQSQKIVDKWSNRSQEERAEIFDRVRETTLERYGVDNYAQTDEAKQRVAKTNFERYGVKAPAQSAMIMERSKAINQAKYGTDWAAQSEIVKDKIKATNLERYGDTHTMTRARDAFYKQTGVNNPFEMKKYQDKARKSMISRYGVEKALSSKAIVAKMREKYREQYGVDHHTQAHIPQRTLEILNDKTLLEEYLADKNMQNASAQLGINGTTLGRYCVKHGIETPGRSSYEREIEYWLTENGISYVANAKPIYPFEIDFVLEGNIGIEFHGLFYHAESIIDGMNKNFKDLYDGRTYHKMKYDMCKEKGIRLISIFEDEWLERPDVIKKKILNVLGRSERGCGARLLRVQEIEYPVAADFLNRNHVQGMTIGTTYVGAFDRSDNLCGVMVFGTSRPTKDFTNGYVELKRFASDGKVYAGLASKMLKWYVSNYQPIGITSFADLRWSEGDLYEKLGFTLQSVVAPDYMYMKNYKKRENKSKFRKEGIQKKFGLDVKNLSESELMKKLGYDRIWDCGKLKFILTCEGTKE